MSIATPTQLTYMHNAQQKHRTEHTLTVMVLVNQVIRKYGHLVSCLILPILYWNIRGWVENQTQKHRKINGLTFPHKIYITYHMLRAGVGNYLQLFEMLGCEGNETTWNLYSKFPMTCFIQFLPYVGIHSENPLYLTIMHMYEWNKFMLHCASM